MFDKNSTHADYYADPDGHMYRSKDFKRGFSPVWLLPLLLIPLGLLFWGGTQLLNQNTVASETTVNTPTPTGAQAGVGGGPNATGTPSATPIERNRGEAGVGGAPGDVAGERSVPSSPATGHGW